MTIAVASYEDPRSLAEMQRVYWPSLLAAAFAAAVLPWALGVVDVDLRPALRLLLVGGFTSVVLLHWADTSTKPVLQAAPYFAGVLLLQAVWYCLGAFKTPGFLLLLVLPVLASALVSRGWLEYAVVALAIVGSWAVALLASPELQWYVGQLSGLGGGLGLSDTAVLDALRLESTLAGHEQFVILGFVAVTLLGVVLLGRTAARTIDRLSEQLHDAVRARHEMERLARGLVEVSDEIEAFVAPATGEIMRANESFAAELGGASGGTIFERLRPEFPEDLQRLLASPDGGELRHWACRMDGRYRMLDVSVRPFALDGAASGRVHIRTTEQGDLVAAAIEDLGLGIAVLGPDRRVLAVNRGFAALFPRALTGQPADHALDGAYGLPEGWWDVAPKPRAHSRFEIAGARYLVAIALVGATTDSARTLLHVERDPEDD